MRNLQIGEMAWRLWLGSCVNDFESRITRMIRIARMGVTRLDDLFFNGTHGTWHRVIRNAQSVNWCDGVLASAGFLR